MSITKEELKEIVGDLSEDESRNVYFPTQPIEHQSYSLKTL